MKVLVVNAGSSSMKYQLFNMDTEEMIAKGNCERIGTDGFIGHKTADGREYEAEIAMPTHSEAFEALVYALTKSDAKVIDDMKEIVTNLENIIELLETKNVSSVARV